MTNKKDAIVLTISSNKGGVTKTTTAYTIACTAARILGMNKVLAVDVDPQANLTSRFLGVGVSNGPLPKDPKFLREVILGQCTLSEAIRVIALEDIPGALPASNIHVLPAYRNLRDIDRDTTIPETRLADILDQVIEFYDLIVIDTPPDVTKKLARSVMYITDHVITPVTPGQDEIIGVGETVRLIEEFQSSPRLNPTINHYGVLLTKATRTIVTRSTKTALEKQFPGKVLQTIPESTEVSQATASGCDIIQYNQHNPVAQAYGVLIIKMLRAFQLMPEKKQVSS